jgi:hypothetical protein
MGLLAYSAKITRVSWTDVVKVWIYDHKEELSEGAYKYMYANVSDILNVGLFGRKAKKLKQDWDLKENAHLRDFMNEEELEIIHIIEHQAKRLLLEGMNPVEAMRESLKRNNFPIITR